MTGNVVWESNPKYRKSNEPRRYRLEYADPAGTDLWFKAYYFHWKLTAWLQARSLEDLFVTRIVDTKPEMVRQSLYDRAFAS